jgi:hypothetical protein
MEAPVIVTPDVVDRIDPVCLLERRDKRATP